MNIVKTNAQSKPRFYAIELAYQRTLPAESSEVDDGQWITYNMYHSLRLDGHDNIQQGRERRIGSRRDFRGPNGA